jgi:TatD DNase family protein
MNPLVDSHAHLCLAESRGVDLKGAFMEFCQRPGSWLMDIGTEANDLESRLKAIRKAWQALDRGAAYPPFLGVSAGLYPSKENLDDPEAALTRLEAHIESFYPATFSINGAAGNHALPRLAAIGECGMDFHWMEAAAETQRRLFDGQLRLAARLGLAVIVHSRKAHDDTLAALKERSPSVKAVIHCYGYGVVQAREYLDAGAYISFCGNMSYKNSTEIREAAAFVPVDRLLCETDAPYLNPEPGRGKPSGPLDVERTFSLLARIRSEEEGYLAERISANALELFGA